MLYYFPVASFVPLSLTQKSEISFAEAIALLELNLGSQDREKVECLRRPIDLRNMRALWLKEPLDPRGNLGEKELEEALLVREGLPSYVEEFLERYEGTEERLRHFGFLYAALYRSEQDGFLGKYFAMEREIRLTLVAMRAKREGRDLMRELQFEDPTDPLVAHILAQKDSPTYSPEDEEIGHLFTAYAEDPLELTRAFLALRFKRIEEMEENRPFTIDQVLGFLARLLLVESWQEATRMSGGERLLGDER